MSEDDATGMEVAAEATGDLALANADLADVRARMKKADEDYRRHLVWLLMGISPGALVPLLYAISDMGAAAIITIIGVAIVVESWKAFQSKSEVKRLRIEAADLRDRIAEIEEDRLLES